MKIRSIEELENLKRESAGRMGARANSPMKDIDVEVTVGTATCGLAAGAENVVKAIKDEIEKLGLKNVRVVEVGCIGFCYHEPIVQVNKPSEASVFYGTVDADTAREIVRRHIAGNERVEKAIINLEFDRA